MQINESFVTRPAKFHQPQSVGNKYHLTFKTVNADAKLVSQICHAHGFHEVHASNSDYNLMWTGVHPKPHAFKSMLPHQVGSPSFIIGLLRPW